MSHSSNISCSDPQEIPSDGWRDLESMPDDMRLLFVEGYCQVPWMQEQFVKAFKRYPTFRVWCTDPSYLDTNDSKPDAFGIERCIDEIESGAYHGIVVVDYSNPEMVEKFENDPGSHLQDFVRKGGVVAFPSSEGLIVRTLAKYFDVEWKRSDYYRTTWGPCPENELVVNYSFGNGELSRRVVVPYSAKGTAMKNVPSHERCFGVTPDSRTQSLVPMMDGRDVSRTGDSEETSDYDVIVAVHDYGSGCVAYLGDVNCEDETSALVKAFVTSRSPKLPIDHVSNRVDDESFAILMDLKNKGNEAFKEGRLDDAITCYQDALEKYGRLSKGAVGPQKVTRVSLLSNLALIHFRKKSWTLSESYASEALKLDADHAKSLYRRAAARLEISLADPKGDVVRLKGAEKDLLDIDFTSPSEHRNQLKLMNKIEQASKKIKNKSDESFRSNLAKGF